jgi:uncharacterized protein (TIGR03435 family)
MLRRRPNSRPPFLALLLTASLAVPDVLAQANSASPPPVSVSASIAYDVVSIRLNKSNSNDGSARANPDGEIWVNGSLENLIGPAYGVEEDQVYGLPDWVKFNRYDIQVKVAPEDIPAYRKVSRAQGALMMQTVLADRLKLRAHLGSKEVPMYNLVIAKSGPKLHQAKPGDTYADGIKAPDGTPIGGSFVTDGPGMFIGQQVTIDSLLHTLKKATGRQVIDKTGLTSKCDISLRWLPEQGPTPMLNGEPDTSLPSIFSVLEEQLGLKLEPAKGTIKTLIIDHIEPPSEN